MPQEKNLLAYAKNLFESPELQKNNGYLNHRLTEVQMLAVVRKHVQTHYTVQLPEPQSLHLSPDGAFNNHNPGDLIALIFESIVKVNWNQNLWVEPGDGGIDGEIKTTLRNYFLGPRSIGGAPEEGVHEDRYNNALERLIHIIDNRKPF
ncbi:hypothetical protein PHLH7_26150 [Pseudomonas sp. Ost2]|uniref:hypothetical protein n=1 Tax=Pseudomonas sp. Ost2 TaxID=2678260 RepID=UPI001BB4370B|nr:hypothetical protein [Pseudomonas sp. Ost2]BBP76511.1 hypothetical protein PHLH7_26150 [Pseudomonas sp. Ost2]